jgi:hypothetical protein
MLGRTGVGRSGSLVGRTGVGGFSSGSMVGRTEAAGVGSGSTMGRAGVGGVSSARRGARAGVGDVRSGSSGGSAGVRDVRSGSTAARTVLGRPAGGGSGAGAVASGSTSARAGRCSRPFGAARTPPASCRASGSISARAGLGWSLDSGLAGDAVSCNRRIGETARFCFDGRTTVGGPSSSSGSRGRSPESSGVGPGEWSKLRDSPRSTASGMSGRMGSARRGRGGGCSRSSMSSSGSTGVGSAAGAGPLERRGMYLTTGSVSSGSSKSARRGRVTGTVFQAFERLAQGSNVFVPEGTRSLPAKHFRKPGSGRIVDVCPSHTTPERTPSACRPCTALVTTE